MFGHFGDFFQATTSIFTTLYALMMENNLKVSNDVPTWDADKLLDLFSSAVALAGVCR